MKPVFFSLPTEALTKVGATTGLFFVVLFSLSAQNRYYVHAAATGTNNGQSWTDAFTDLQSALQTAQMGDEVWIAEGTYYPTDLTDRKVSFEPASGTKLYGGFTGTETSLGQRDWMAHPVVLSGDIGMVGDSTDNVYNVVYLFEPDTNTLLDGFVIRDGVANNGGALPSRDRKRCGGGLYIMGQDADAYPDIRNCVFIHNSATAFGGGVMMNGGGQGSVAPRFVNCRFEQNHAVASGGGAARFGGSWIERGDDFAGCVFLRNRADYRGGGFYYTDTERNDRLDIHGCSFQENRAVDDGGGAYIIIGRLNPSGFSIRSTSFIGNIADDGAAFITNPTNFLYGNYLDMDSCEFIGNVLVHYNSPQPAVVKVEILGAIGSKGQIKNCRFQSNNNWRSILDVIWNDSEGLYDKIVMKDNESIEILLVPGNYNKTIISNSIFSQNSFNGIICRNGVAKTSSYYNCIFENNISMATGEYIYFANDTLTIYNCTFADNEVGQSGNYNSNQSIKLAYNCVLSGINNVYRFLYTNNHGEYSYCSFDSIDCALIAPIIHCGPGNIVGLDPRFRDTANHDYSLLPCSPLINAGSNAAAAGLLTDITGNPRIQEGRVDIGAYEAPAFSLAAMPEVKPACVGSSNGSITVNPVMGCEPYHYDWSPQAGNGPELNGLPPGDYRLTITDGSGRQILDTVQVASVPMPVLNPTVSDVQCITGLGGSISAGVSSGTAPFHYQWLPSAADTASLHHLSPGAYALTVVDANGCQDSASASIFLSGMLTLMVGGQGIPCYGETGWLSATPLTGAAPFHWLWQGWPGTDSIAQPLSPGVYAVTVSDTYGCTAAFAFPPMTQPDSLWATVGTSPQTDLNMPNGAAIVTTISGGSSPFGFEWNTGNTTQALTGIAAGIYTVTVKDKNGCEAVVEVVVDLMVGTNEAEGQALLLYPNPATDWLKVVLPASATAHWVELSDASGRVLRSALLPTLPAEVWTKAGATANCQINLQGLPAGDYWVRVRNGAGKEMFVGKVLKI